jgi:hypothetical protein
MIYIANLFHSSDSSEMMKLWFEVNQSKLLEPFLPSYPKLPNELPFRPTTFYPTIIIPDLPKSGLDWTVLIWQE